MRILFDVMYCVKRQMSKFFKFAVDSSLIKKCRWTEMNCGGAELGSYDQSMSFNVWFNPSGYKVFSFKIQRFSCFFRSFLVSSIVVCFLICLIKVNSACYWKLWLGLLKCLQANIDFSDLAFLLKLFRRMLKVVSFIPTHCSLHFRYWSKYMRFLLLHVRSWLILKSWFVL